MLTAGLRARRPRDFASNRSAVAAVEFSIILPMLLALGLGGAELMRYLLIQKQIGKAAESISMMLGAFERPVTNSDFEFMYDTTMVTVPFATTDAGRLGNTWRDVMEVGMSSLEFQKADATCKSDCVLQPTVRWRTGTRACGVQSFSSSPDMSSIPADLRGSAGSLVVADVRYTYSPWLGSNFLPAFTVTRSSFHQPRFLDFVGANGPGHWTCQ